MSDYQAIAAVSATLKALLEDRMALTASALPPNSRVTISISHPDVKATSSPTGPRLNLFLYEIAHNPFLRNQEMGGPGSPGFPPLALELHYMLTCFPAVADDDQTMHAVLGDAMLVLHDLPVLGPHLVRTRGLTAGEPLLHEGLRDSFEQVKISFHTQNLETGTKVWSALSDAYRLSVTFSVSAVQIESARAVAPSAPVREPRIFAAPAAAIAVTGVSPAHASVGQLLAITGTNLDHPAIAVRIGTADAPVIKASATELVVAVPDDPALQPGRVPVVVFTGPHPGVSAATAAFTLLPRPDSPTA